LLNVRLAEMDLAELESVFELLLFGSIGERAAPPALPQTPDQPVTAGAPPPPRKTVPSIFERAEPEVDLAKSGIFGMARDQLKAALEAAQETPAPARPFWQTVQRQTSLPDCVTRFIQVFADRNPTLLIIDDLHRADATTLAMLKQVVAEIAKSRLMVLVTCEPPEDDPDLGIQRKVTVSDLEEDETAQLAARVLNAHEVGPRLRALIWERTKGRPLFVESLLHLLDQDGHIKKTGARAELAGDMSIDTLPDNVRQLLTSQIDRLSADARALLQVASVLGDGFTAEMLIALSEGAASEIRLETLLGEMIFEEIIEPLPDMTYRFRHGLAQATVYESLSRLQRQRLHRDAADFLADHGDPDRVALKVAYHLVKGGLPLRGIELVSQAADRAEQNQQLDRAIELYTHARDIFPHDESVRAQLERLQALRA
jgi:predicted ATPase